MNNYTYVDRCKRYNIQLFASFRISSPDKPTPNAVSWKTNGESDKSAMLILPDPKSYKRNTSCRFDLDLHKLSIRYHLFKNIQQKLVVPYKFH